MKVQLEPGWHSYARVLEEPLFAVYDSRTDRDLPLHEIKDRRVLFKIWVMNKAVTSGRWPVVGHLPLEAHDQEVPAFFKQDPLDPRALSIYQGGKERKATRDECIGLESAAVWDPEHVEDRLRDHYAGKLNKWVESLRIRP